MNILETRKKIEQINSKYDSQVAELKIKISEIEAQRNKELGDLPGEYDALCSQIIEQFENGSYNKISGVTVKTLKNVVIVDERKVPVNYMKYVVDDKKIKADLKESGYTMNIPGVKVTNKYSVAVTLK